MTWIIWTFRLILSIILMIPGILLLIRKDVIGFTGPMEWIGKPYIKNLHFDAPDYYKKIRQSVKPNVNSIYKPVHILTYRQGRLTWLGSGTHFTQKSSGIEYVLTAAHLFGSNIVGTNVFLFIYPNDPEGICYGINDIIKADSLINPADRQSLVGSDIDVALCKKGPIKLLVGYSNTKLISFKEEVAVENIKDSSLVLTSLATGIAYRALWTERKIEPQGHIGIEYVVFDYQPQFGESGSGFLGSDGRIYVAYASIESKTGQFKLKPRTSKAARAIRIKIH